MALAITRFWATYCVVMALAVYLGYRSYLRFYFNRLHRFSPAHNLRAFAFAGYSLGVISLDVRLAGPLCLLIYVQLLFCLGLIHYNLMLRSERAARKAILKELEDELGDG